MVVREIAPPVLELRQYLLRRGRRDELVELFDREFIESQESDGMRVVGQFRDVDRPNRFVWLRGFADHEARAAGLTRFYSGPVWERYGAAANSTMIDSDDVLLLRPASAGSEQLSIRAPSERDRMSTSTGVLIVVAHRQADRRDECDEIVAAGLDRFAAEAEVALAGRYETDPTPNGYPALPVRRADCLVWIATTSSEGDLERAAELTVPMRATIQRDAAALGLTEIQLDIRRLVPTTRSTLGRISRCSAMPASARSTRSSRSQTD